MRSDCASSEVALVYLPEEQERSVAGQNPSANFFQYNLLDRAITWWVGLALMLGCLLIPLILTEVPPLTDYPNHLARCYLLAFGSSDPALRHDVLRALANYP